MIAFRILIQLKQNKEEIPYLLTFVNSWSPWSNHHKIFQVMVFLCVYNLLSLSKRFFHECYFFLCEYFCLYSTQRSGCKSRFLFIEMYALVVLEMRGKVNRIINEKDLYIILEVSKIVVNKPGLLNLIFIYSKRSIHSWFVVLINVKLFTLNSNVYNSLHYTI